MDSGLPIKSKCYENTTTYPNETKKDSIKEL